MVRIAQFSCTFRANNEKNQREKIHCKTHCQVRVDQSNIYVFTDGIGILCYRCYKTIPTPDQNGMETIQILLSID